jgi:CBS domain-containing protein
MDHERNERMNRCAPSGMAVANDTQQYLRPSKGVRMHVKDVMTPDPRVCSTNTNLAAAAELMLDGDCGILPVLEEGRLAGIITDRDMYIALATRNRRASELTVGEVARREVLTCRPEDDVRSVIETMKTHRVRRLPVEGFGGTVVGIISMNDLLLAAGPRKPVRSEDVLGALQAICAHHQPTPHVTAA